MCVIILFGICDCINVILVIINFAVLVELHVIERH